MLERAPDICFGVHMTTKISDRKYDIGVKVQGQIYQKSG